VQHVINRADTGEEPDTGIEVFNQSTKPDESQASAGDVWLNRYAYLPRGLWKFAPSSGTNFNHPFAIDDTRIYAIESDGNTLWALSYDNEFYSVEWSVSGVDCSNVIVDSSGVYVGNQEDNTAYKYDLTDGSELWSTALSDEPDFIEQDASDIFISEADSSDANTLVSLDKSDGSVNWESDVTNPTRTILLTDNTNVYYADEINQVLNAVKKADGSLNWTNNSVGDASPDHAIAQDTDNVYYGGDNGNVYGVDKTDGSAINNGLTSFTSNRITSLQVDDTHLYINVDDDGVYKHDKLQDDQIFDAVFTDTTAGFDSNIYLTDSAVYFANQLYGYKLDLSLNIVWYTKDVYTIGNDPYTEERNGEVYFASANGFHAVVDENERADGTSHTFNGTQWFLE
jgi:hypothetical protein